MRRLSSFFVADGPTGVAAFWLKSLIITAVSAGALAPVPFLPVFLWAISTYLWFVLFARRFLDLGLSRWWALAPMIVGPLGPLLYFVYLFGGLYTGVLDGNVEILLGFLLYALPAIALLCILGLGVLPSRKRRAAASALNV